MTRKRIQVLARGKVQGVFFRASTRARATELGLVGWVRNETDGSVLIQAEGPDHAIESFVAWCRRGPQLARVDELILEDCTPRNDEMSFAVQHHVGE